MANLKAFLEGMDILKKYCDLSDYMCAEHDILYICDYEGTVSKMTEVEKDKLEELGFFESEDSWAIYT
jgi:hypothetical protein